jgi:hypothetical protein
VDNLKNAKMPSDLVGMIVNQAIEQKPVICLREKSVFPAPISSVPGHQLGGWVVIELEPMEASASGGIAQFDLTYTRMDGSTGKVTKTLPLLYDSSVVDEGMSVVDEGMEKALALQHFVSSVKALLANEKEHDFPADFLEWFALMGKKFDLEKQAATLNKLREQLKKVADEKAKKDGPIDKDKVVDELLMG